MACGTNQFWVRKEICTFCYMKINIAIYLVFSFKIKHFKIFVIIANMNNHTNLKSTHVINV